MGIILFHRVNLERKGMQLFSFIQFQILLKQR